MERKGNPEALKRAAEKRKVFTENKLLEAINRIETNTSIRIKLGKMLTPSSVAREADVGRDTVYRYEKVIEYIKRKKIEQKAGLLGRKRTVIRDVQDKLDELLRIKIQLTTDKENLARENNRLQFENEELKDRLQRYQIEIEELRNKLAGKSKILPIRKSGV